MKTSLRIIIVFASVLASACGFGQGEGAEYEGLYGASGSVTYTWPGGSQTVQHTANRTLAEGMTSELIYAEENCAFPADIEGKVATFVPNSNCTVSESGVSQTLTVTSGTLVLGERIITVNVTGTFLVTSSDGTATGNFTINETLTKKSK